MTLYFLCWKGCRYFVIILRFFTSSFWEKNLKKEWFCGSRVISIYVHVRICCVGGGHFGGWGCVLCRAGASPVMRASPSTCRVLAIDWQVRGLYRCLCLTHVVCAWVRVQPFPGVITSLQTQGAKYRFSGFIKTHKQTNKVPLSLSHARGLCLSPCAIIPRGYYFPPDTGSEV